MLRRNTSAKSPLRLDSPAAGGRVSESTPMRYIFAACCAAAASGAARRPPAKVPMNARRSMVPFPSLPKCTWVLTGLGPERGRPRLEAPRVVEQSQDLLIPALLALGLPLPAPLPPAGRRACRQRALERVLQAARALPGA